MTITLAQFSKLNEIALVLVRKIDTKTYDEMCDILNDIYKTDLAEIEECAKDITVGSLVNEDDSVCPRDSYEEHLKAAKRLVDATKCTKDCYPYTECTTNCTIRGEHKHTEAF